MNKNLIINNNLLDKENIDWCNISKYQKLSEEFIEKYQDKVDWYYISVYQNLSEEFIEKFQKKVDWCNISMYQKLSEDFIEKFQDKVNWKYISKYQKISEEFIDKYQDKVDWYYISIYQKLSEDFIEKFQNRVNWKHISKYQKISEEFIDKYQDKVNLDFISIYQKLSNDFIKKFNIKIDEDNWLYKDKEFKLNYIKKNTDYEIVDDNYIIAYKAIRLDNYSVYNFQYQYFVNGVYESHCDCTNTEDSFGLSAWDIENAKYYYDKGKIIKVKINIEDIGRIVKNNNKIRCFRLEVLEEI